MFLELMKTIMQSGMVRDVEEYLVFRVGENEV